MSEFEITEKIRNFGELSCLLDRCFQVPEGKRFFDDFPFWEEHACHHPTVKHQVGVYHQGKLVATAGARRAELKFSSRRLPVVIIGAVATDPGHRGRGLATQAVSAVLSWARLSGARLAALWTSEPKLYEKLGFRYCGAQIRLPLSRIEFTARADSGCTLSVRQGWNPNLMKLLKVRPLGLVIHDSDAQWIGAHKNVAWFWTGLTEDPTAYLAYGRGIDLEGIVHEWGGDASWFRELLLHFAAQHPEASLLGQRLLFSDMGIRSRQGCLEEPLCMARILDPSMAPAEALRLLADAELWLWGLDGV